MIEIRDYFAIETYIHKQKIEIRQTRDMENKKEKRRRYISKLFQSKTYTINFLWLCSLQL